MGLIRNLLILAKTTLLAGILFSPTSLANNATPPTQLESAKIKIAYLVNFARYIHWPNNAFANSNSPLIIGISKNNRYARELKNKIVGKTKGNRKIIFKVLTNNKHLKGVHILYLQSRDKNTFSFKHISKSTLIVGDSNNFIKEGGIVQLIEDNKKIKFYIDRDKAEEAGLKVHYKILEMSRNSSKTE